MQFGARGYRPLRGRNRRRTETKISRSYLPSLAILSVNRDTLRLAALRCTMPFCAERTITGSASLSAASAWARSPVAIASSTLRTKLRIFDRRALLISVRRAILRVALRAEVVLAMPVLGSRGCAWPGHSIIVKPRGGEGLPANARRL